MDEVHERAVDDGRLGERLRARLREPITVGDDERASAPPMDVAPPPADAGAEVEVPDVETLHERVDAVLEAHQRSNRRGSDA